MRQRGVALITAIVVVAIATILAVRIGTRAALDLRRTAGLVALDQGWHVALGAEAWAIEALKEDWRNASGPQKVDHLAEAWAQPLPPLPIDGGEVRGVLEDMQGRFNLNNLINAEHKPDDKNVRRFQQLLILVGAQPRWASLMADWIDDDTMPDGDGAEDGTYLGQSPPYRAANGLVVTTTEMMALPGMTREEFERIRPYVAALPPGTALNVCTAKAAVLTAFVGSSTDFSNEELLASNRREGCYPSKEFLRPLVQDWSSVEDDFSESTDWFRALTAVRIGTSEFTLYSLINRNGSDTAIRTVLRSTGTE
ncbi:MAG TPA: type II secretion system minor pseudopilin GspK [Steroidobacteraceae bacterium]|jgi:general secretion pathway protein K|nr:type II secretion system minor pseudopilin GspK [Steroidobacteraceae bacterium]